PIPELAWMLDGVPPARLFDEVNKLLLAGHGAASFEMLAELGLLQHLLPDLHQAMQKDPASPALVLLRQGLTSTDQRVREGKSVTPTFLFAVLLWPAIQAAFQRMDNEV